MSLVVTVTGAAIPEFQATVDTWRAAGAARNIASRVQRARMEAVSRSANVGLQFVQVAVGYSYGTYVDGNGDGVRTLDIKNGVDRPIGVVEQLANNFPGVDFGALPGLPPVDPGGTAPGTDPIRLGASNILSFSPLGTSSSGSVYIRGRGAEQYVIRIFGETGRTRILRFDVRTQQWKAL